MLPIFFEQLIGSIRTKVWVSGWLLPPQLSKEKKKQALADERIRNAIEGKFGQAKRRFSLARVMAKLDNTSPTTIAIAFLVMNLVAGSRQLSLIFLCQFSSIIIGFARKISKSYV